MKNSEIARMYHYDLAKASIFEARRCDNIAMKLNWLDIAANWRKAIKDDWLYDGEVELTEKTVRSWRLLLRTF